MKSLLYTVLGLTFAAGAAKAQSGPVLPLKDTSTQIKNMIVVDKLYDSKTMKGVKYGVGSNGQLLQMNFNPSYGGVQDGLELGMLQESRTRKDSISAKIGDNLVQLTGVDFQRSDPVNPPLVDPNSSANLKAFAKNAVYFSIRPVTSKADFGAQSTVVKVPGVERNMLNPVLNK